MRGGRFILVFLFLIIGFGTLVAEPLYTGIGSRRVAHFFSPDESYVSIPSPFCEDERPVFSCGYVPRSPFVLQPAAGPVDWAVSMHSTLHENQQSAHFALEVVRAATAERKIGLVLYLASEQAKKDGTYDVRIEIVQQPPNATVAVYNSNGEVLRGPLPLRPQADGVGKKPYLPWSEGRRQFYSLVCEKRGEEVYLLLIQHTQDAIYEYVYVSPIVKDIVEAYSYHERLQNRPFGYLDLSEHMRCLPLPYVHLAYRVFGDGPLYISWSSLEGTFEVMPA